MNKLLSYCSSTQYYIMIFETLIMSQIKIKTLNLEYSEKENEIRNLDK